MIMSETLLIWLFGGMGAWLVLLSGFVMKVLLTQVKMQVAMDLFVDSLGARLAKALHSPDNHLGIDHYLDKYLDRNYELSFEEWEEFRKVCMATENNEKATELERMQAAGLAIICEHKLHMSPRSKRLHE